MRRLTREINQHQLKLESLTRILEVVVEELGADKVREIVQTLENETGSVQKLKEAETFADLSTLKMPTTFRVPRKR